MQSTSLPSPSVSSRSDLPAADYHAEHARLRDAIVDVRSRAARANRAEFVAMQQHLAALAREVTQLAERLMTAPLEKGVFSLKVAALHRQVASAYDALEASAATYSWRESQRDIDAVDAWDHDRRRVAAEVQQILLGPSLPARRR